MATKRMTAIERMNVLLEDMRTQNRVMFEALSLDALERRVALLEKRRAE